MKIERVAFAFTAFKTFSTTTDLSLVTFNTSSVPSTLTYTQQSKLSCQYFFIAAQSGLWQAIPPCAIEDWDKIHHQ